MIHSFIKYQSLGNNFILFDWYTKKVFSFPPSWPTLVKNLCHRHKGIGADGVLVLLKKDLVPFVHIFNADGSDGQLCLNGARCVAHHLYTTYGCEKNPVIPMGNQDIKCTFFPLKETFVQQVPLGNYLGQKTIFVDKQSYDGHCIDVGNPHFILMQQTTPQWLATHGYLLEQHESFPNKTNVSFVWPEPNKPHTYNVLVYERGCGLTQACSSGAAALTTLLFSQNLLPFDEKTTLVMPGGMITTWVNTEELVALEAPATPIFAGKITIIPSFS